MVLPYTANQAQPAACFVSLLLRPLVSPRCPASVREKRMEVRFFAPGGLVSNLDFVEAIFGNAGDPYLPENDAALDPEHWTGHTGCVDPRPAPDPLTKKELGLPHVERRHRRQRRDGMCWSRPDELYNGGRPSRSARRDAPGVIVTLIADNYFGYCKKEVKTQISYAANLFGNAEEEHAGGALVFAQLQPRPGVRGDVLAATTTPSTRSLERDPGAFAAQPEGHALDRSARHRATCRRTPPYSLRTMTCPGRPRRRAAAHPAARRQGLPQPLGYRVQIASSPTTGRRGASSAPSPTATSCHKPATVSGGGKSEISKAITRRHSSTGPLRGGLRDATWTRSPRSSTATTPDASATRPGTASDHRARSCRADRSIGSVIKLLTPVAPSYTDEYNAWLRRIPPYVKELVFVVKRSYRPEWGDDWREPLQRRRRSTGGRATRCGCDGTKVTTDHAARRLQRRRVVAACSGLRQDFSPGGEGADRGRHHRLDRRAGQRSWAWTRDRSYKFVENCEYRLFQRPDDAIHRGLRQAGRARHRHARHVPVQLRAADPGGRRRHA